MLDRRPGLPALPPESFNLPSGMAAEGFKNWKKEVLLSALSETPIESAEMPDVSPYVLAIDLIGRNDHLLDDIVFGGYAPADERQDALSFFESLDDFVRSAPDAWQDSSAGQGLASRLKNVLATNNGQINPAMDEFNEEVGRWRQAADERRSREASPSGIQP